MSTFGLWIPSPFNHHLHYTDFFLFFHTLLGNLVHAIYRVFSALKSENSIGKKNDNFNMFAQNIDCGYTLEPSSPGVSNMYPQSMFWNKHNKIMYTPANFSFSI